MTMLERLDSDALTARLRTLLSEERRTMVEFLFQLAELDRRQLHLELGYGSLFAYCFEALRLPKASAFRRSQAARLLGEFPRAAEYLVDGRLCLTTLVELRHVLTDENHEELFDRAAGMTEDEVKAMVAGTRPEPPRRMRLRQISDRHFTLEITVDREFVGELERVKALLSHQVPDGDIEAVLRECMRRTAKQCERRRRGGDRPRPGKPAGAVVPGRHIPAAVRRQVWARDEGRCAYVGPTGKRCGSEFMVEFHHVVPFARGGPATVDNITLHCAVHNQYEADRDFGRAHMEAARERHLW